MGVFSSPRSSHVPSQYSPCHLHENIALAHKIAPRSPPSTTTTTTVGSHLYSPHSERVYVCVFACSCNVCANCPSELKAVFPADTIFAHRPQQARARPLTGSRDSARFSAKLRECHHRNCRLLGRIVHVPLLRVLLSVGAVPVSVWNDGAIAHPALDLGW